MQCVNSFGILEQQTLFNKLGRQDSNLRPPDYESGDIATNPRPNFNYKY